MEKKRFEGKVVLVTGGSRNTGLEIVDLFLREGARVFFCGSSAASTQAGANELKRRGLAGFTGVPCDIGKRSEVEAMMDVIEREAGRLDAVVSNAADLGLGQDKTLELKEEDFFRTLNTNLGGTLRLAQLATNRFFLKQEPNPVTGQRGAIVCIGSNTSTAVQRNLVSYCTSKGGLDALVRCLATDLGPLGIRVNELCPGYIWTERWLNMPEKIQAKRLANTLIGRVSTGRDVAEAAAFLVSDAAPTFQGARLVMDCGATVSQYPAYCMDKVEPYPAEGAKVTCPDGYLKIERQTL